jgi:hypothetical protein
VLQAYDQLVGKSDKKFSHALLDGYQYHAKGVINQFQPGGESVDDRTMTKAADDRSGGRRRSRRHNNLPSTEGFSSSIGGNSNSCRNGGGKGNGGSEGYEDKQQRR